MEGWTLNQHKKNNKFLLSNPKLKNKKQGRREKTKSQYSRQFIPNILLFFDTYHALSSRSFLRCQIRNSRICEFFSPSFFDFFLKIRRIYFISYSNTQFQFPLMILPMQFLKMLWIRVNNCHQVFFYSILFDGFFSIWEFVSKFLWLLI